MAQVVRGSLLVREMGFKSRADQISHTLPTTHHRCKLTTFEVWALAQSRGDGHRSLVTSERVLSECNEDLILISTVYQLKTRLITQHLSLFARI